LQRFQRSAAAAVVAKPGSLHEVVVPVVALTVSIEINPPEDLGQQIKVLQVETQALSQRRPVLAAVEDRGPLVKLREVRILAATEAQA